MKVLVTGGAGFIGSHLVDTLIDKGYNVVVLDNLSNSDKTNVNENAEFIKGDIRSENDVKKAISDCEAVFHLAGLIDIVSNDPDKDFQVNFLGSRNVFSHARKANAKIIFTSSAAVYGNTKPPVSEDSPCNPISQYGKSKLKAEKSLPDNSFILRLFNVYGSRSKTGVIKKFVESVLNFEPVKVFGNGLQTRDFVHVSDVVNALMLGLEKDAKGVYNVGTSVETSIINLLDMIYSITSIKPHIKFMPERQEEIKRSRADITKINIDFGWSPRVNLEQGLRNLIEEIKK